MCNRRLKAAEQRKTFWCRQIHVSCHKVDEKSFTVLQGPEKIDLLSIRLHGPALDVIIISDYCQGKNRVREECVRGRTRNALTWKFSLKKSTDYPHKGVTGLSLSQLGPEHDSSPDSRIEYRE